MWVHMAITLDLHPYAYHICLNWLSYLYLTFFYSNELPVCWSGTSRLSCLYTWIIVEVMLCHLVPIIYLLLLSRSHSFTSTWAYSTSVLQDLTIMYRTGGPNPRIIPRFFA